MKVPVWLQVQIERELDPCQPCKLEINFNGTSEFKLKVERYYTAPKERSAGMTEY
jgi:hypothetical protein